MNDEQREAALFDEKRLLKGIRVLEAACRHPPQGVDMDEVRMELSLARKSLNEVRDQLKALGVRP